MAVKTEGGEQTAVDYLEHAVDDLNQARLAAQEEIRSSIDSSISRAREALDDLQSDARERAKNARTRAEDRATEWQHTLEDATDDVRRELGLRAVRAQRDPDALDEIADEIQTRRKELL